MNKNKRDLNIRAARRLFRVARAAKARGDLLLFRRAYARARNSIFWARFYANRPVFFVVSASLMHTHIFPRLPADQEPVDDSRKVPQSTACSGLRLLRLLRRSLVSNVQLAMHVSPSSACALHQPLRRPLLCNRTTTFHRYRLLRVRTSSALDRLL